MPEVGYVQPILEVSRIDSSQVPQRISYSQWSMYETCPKRWELSYIKKLAPYEQSIHTAFGTAMHETMQNYLTVLFTEGKKQSDWIDLHKDLTERLRNEYKKGVEEMGRHFSTPKELAEFANDGIAILDWFKKRRGQYFSTRNDELVGIELDLCIPASERNPNVYWYGFMDLIIRNKKTNTYNIIDIKTSTKGWNKWQKADKLKLAQAVTYKTYFSRQYGVPVDNVNVSFFIVRRKVDENSMYPMKRVQEVKPASGSVTRKKIQQRIDKFVEQCFDSEGNRNESGYYPALAGKGAKNCKYCIFKEDYENCPKDARIRESNSL